jgi:hypothetical protein
MVNFPGTSVQRGFVTEVAPYPSHYTVMVEIWCYAAHRQRILNAMQEFSGLDDMWVGDSCLCH